mgnify:CR=1 FL=1
MEGTNLLALVPTILSSVVIASSITALVTWRLGVKGNEREARKDEREAEDRLSSVALDWIRELRSEVDALKEAWAQLRDHKVSLEDHIDLLEDHIYKQKPPPPPQRPIL